MSRRSVTSAVLGGAVAATLALAACGSTAAPAAPAASSSASPSSATSTAGSSATTAASDVAQKMADAMKAAKTGKAVLTTTASGMTINGTTNFAYSGDNSMNSSGTSSIGGMSLEVRQIGPDVYIKGFPAQMSGGKTWVKVDSNGTDAMSQQLRKSTDNGPQQMVEGLKGGTAKVISSDGGNTVYEITGITSQGLAGATMELTVDGKGLPVTSVIKAQGVDVTMTYSDWGAPVTIDAPPADQVGTLAVPKT